MKDIHLDIELINLLNDTLEFIKDDEKVNYMNRLMLLSIRDIKSSNSEDDLCDLAVLSHYAIDSEVVLENLFIDYENVMRRRN